MFATSCPSVKQLRALAWGQVPDEESHELFAHVEECATCKSELASVDDVQDSLIYTLRAPDEQARWNAEPDCQRAVAQAREALLGPGSIRTASETDAIGPAPRIPTEIGEYRIERPLGHGGMGCVFLAQHSKLGRQVALKILASHRLPDATMRERFETEMRAVGNLSHPNIVAAHDARDIDGMAVLITEFIDGFDLGELVRRTGPLAQADACEIIRQVAVALQYTHEQGFVHRDVKPSNIMLSQAGQVKLLDLGLARVDGVAGPSELTASGQAMGTADYIAPEQIQDSRSVDVRADIYALGCTLFKLLTGQAPFADARHATAFDKMTAHVSKQPPKLSDHLPGAPEKLVELIEAMLAKAPSARPQQPTEVALKLGEFSAAADLPKLAGLAKDSRPSSSPAKRPPASDSASSYTTSFWNRRVQMSTLVATGFLGTLFGLCLGIILTIRNPDGSLTIMELAQGSSVTVGESTSTHPTSPVQPHRAEGAGVSSSQNIEWIAYDQAKLKSLRSQARPVLLLFTADWDVNGKNLQRQIESDPYLMALIAQHKVTPMLADWTEPSAEIRRGLEEFDISTVPTLAVFPPRHSVGPVVLRDLRTLAETQSAFAAVLAPPPASFQSDPAAAVADEVGGPTLQFAMLVQPESTGKRPFISEKALAELQAILPKIGERTQVRLNNMQLLPVSDSRPNMFPLETWRNGRQYALLSTDPKYSVAWDDIDGRILQMEVDAPSHKLETTISFRFDGTLGERLLRLTENAVGEQLAVIVENQVLTAPKISAPLSDGVKITGAFSEAQVKRLRLGLASAQDLTAQKRMPTAEPSTGPLAPDAETNSGQDPSQVNLERLGVAFHEYLDAHKVLPGSSQNTVIPSDESDTAAHMFSWRVAILPFLGEEAGQLYAAYRFDEPWDSPHNVKLLDQVPTIYRSPYAPIDQPAGHTNYVGFSGAKSALGLNAGISLSQFGDGTSPTLLLVETKSSVPWTKPEDLPFEDYADAKLAVPLDGRALNYLTADGAVHSMSPPIDWDLLGKMITRDGGERIALPE